MVRNNFMMHICTVATLCFPEKTVPRNYYYCVQDDNSLSLCFKSMYRTLFVAIFTSTFIFSMFKSFHTYRNINISNHAPQLLPEEGGQPQHARLGHPCLNRFKCYGQDIKTNSSALFLVLPNHLASREWFWIPMGAF